jgi:flavin reductase (DIM6/NTAB) family NADH-FMN oxidoreductase RutF
MDPALVLFCPNYSSDSYPVLIKNKRFAIHVLSGGQQSEAYAFARKGKDKAQGIEWTLSELGNPILANATAVIECELWREYEGGDHAIMVGGEEPDRAPAERRATGVLPRQDGRIAHAGLGHTANRGGASTRSGAEAADQLIQRLRQRRQLLRIRAWRRPGSPPTAHPRESG